MEKNTKNKVITVSFYVLMLAACIVCWFYAKNDGNTPQTWFFGLAAVYWALFMGWTTYKYVQNPEEEEKKEDEQNPFAKYDSKWKILLHFAWMGFTFGLFMFLFHIIVNDPGSGLDGWWVFALAGLFFGAFMALFYYYRYHKLNKNQE